MKIPKDKQMIPAGGWKVTLENGIVIEQKHPGVFLAKAFQALEASRLYTGEGWQDAIWHQTCEQNPHIACIDTDKPEIVTGWADVRRFFVTLGDLIGSGRPLVEPEVQEKRIQTCLACPNNVDLGACSSCGWVAARLSELAGGRKIKDEPLVHRRGCKSCGCEISIKTAYPLNVLHEVDKRLELKEPYDSNCWVLNEDQ